MADLVEKKDANGNGYIHETSLSGPSEALYDPSKESQWTRLGLTPRSFTRAPGTTGGLVVEGTASGKDVEELRHDNPMLQQTMKNRHLSMIAVGGSIGAGLFVGSGRALTRGGPGGLVIAWILMGIMLLNVTQALGELAIMYPVSGGFYTLASRFIDDSVGMAIGWNYFMQWAVVLPFELIVASFTIQFWDADFKVPLAAYITLFMIAILIFTLFGTFGYAEEEFWSSCLKLTMIVIFLFAALVFVNGGAKSPSPYSNYIGNSIWNNPGAFANGFKGVCSVFVTAAFSFAGTELIGLAATEHPNPRKALPAAVKGTIWRISIVFVASLTMVGLLVPYNDPDLLGGSGSNASPFVIVFVRGGVRGLANLMNAVIAISVLSIGLSCVYAGSRQLMSLAERGYAPKIFASVDRAGRPLWALAAVIVLFPIAYAQTDAEVGTEIFDWLLALSGLSTIFVWMAILVSHVRFRLAWKAQGHQVDELPFRAAGGIYGSFLGIVFLVLVLVAQFYVALFPIGAGTRTSQEIALGFFKAYISAPIVLMFYLVALYWKRGKPAKLTEIDLVTGRKIWLTAEELNAWRARTKTWPWYKRAIRWLFL